MKEQIEQLVKIRTASILQLAGFTGKKPSDQIWEQTQLMVIESIFNQAISNIDSAIHQLKIVDRQML